MNGDGSTGSSAQPDTTTVPVATRPPLNAFAVVSLVMGLFGIAILGAVFGHIALSQIKRRGERGRGIALAGTILGWFWIILVVFLVAGLTAAASSVG